MKEVTTNKKRLEDLERLVVLADDFFTEVLPQAGNMVFQDYGLLNDLGMLLTTLKKENT